MGTVGSSCELIRSESEANNPPSSSSKGEKDLELYLHYQHVIPVVQPN